MPKTFDRAPELPKPRRRIGRDTTELIVTILALSSTVCNVLVGVRYGMFDIESQTEYNFIQYFFLATTVVFWVGMIRLELTAKAKAESLYEVQMKEYEIMRTKWLDIASKKMEIDANRSLEPMKVVQQKQIVVDEVKEAPKVASN